MVQTMRILYGVLPIHTGSVLLVEWQLLAVYSYVLYSLLFDE
jgi:hypothetical protein